MGSPSGWRLVAPCQQGSGPGRGHELSMRTTSEAGRMARREGPGCRRSREPGDLGAMSTAVKKGPGKADPELSWADRIGAFVLQ
eukprot:3187634-Alexandrium_andersonii.AAC.1